MDLKTSHARTQSQIALDKATQSVQYKVSTVEWSAALGALTIGEWYYKQNDESVTGVNGTGISTGAGPLALDFSASGGKSFTTVADTLVTEACTIRSCQVAGAQQGNNPGDRTVEICLAYVSFTPGVSLLGNASNLVSLGTAAATFEDNWMLRVTDLTAFNGVSVPKNCLLYIFVRMTSGPTNNCSVKLRFELERKLCSCA